jgi:hypothetical protein
MKAFKKWKILDGTCFSLRKFGMNERTWVRSIIFTVNREAAVNSLPRSFVPPHLATSAAIHNFRKERVRGKDPRLLCRSHFSAMSYRRAECASYGVLPVGFGLYILYSRAQVSFRELTGEFEVSCFINLLLHQTM